MNEAEVIEIARETVIVLFKVVGPLLLAALTVGIIVSLLQAVTQIQETTLAFIPKMVVIFMMAIWLLPFILVTLNGFTHNLTDRIVQIGTSG